MNKQLTRTRPVDGVGRDRPEHLAVGAELEELVLRPALLLNVRLRGADERSARPQDHRRQKRLDQDVLFEDTVRAEDDERPG